MPSESLYYDTQNHCWLSFKFGEVNIQLCEWKPINAESSQCAWVSIKLDNLKDGLFLWDPESQKTYRFFFINHQLYRYYQDLFDLKFDPALSNELKNGSQKFIGPLQKKFQEEAITKKLESLQDLIDKNFFEVFQAGKIPQPFAQVILSHSQAIKQQLQRNAGFIPEGCFNGKAIRQRIECYANGNWQPTGLAKFSTITGIPIEPKLLPKDIQPTIPPPTTQEKPWDRQRHELPNFSNDIEKHMHPYVRFQLDEMCVHMLISFKEVTESKEHYLQLVRYLLGDKSLQNTFDVDPLIIDVAMQRKEIRKVYSRLVASDGFKETNIHEEQVCQYLLRRIQQEYEVISGKKLDFVPDPKTLPQIKPAQEDDEYLQAARLYENLLNNNSVPSIDIYKILLCLLNTQEEIENKYRYVSHYISTNKRTEIAAQAWCLGKLVQSTISVDIIKSILSALQHYWGTNNLNHQITDYPLFRACIDASFAISLINATKMALTQFDGRSLAWIALAHQEFIPELLKKPDLLEKLNGDQICEIARGHQDFALQLFNQPEILKKLGSNHICWVACKNQAFAMALLNQPTVLKRLNSEQLLFILRGNPQDYVLKLLGQPKTLEKLDGDQVYEVAKFYQAFAMQLVNHHPNLLEKLSSDQLALIAKAHQDFAMQLLKQPELFKKLDGYQVYEIACGHQDFAMQLFNQPEKLEKLDSNHICWVARNHQVLAMALLNQPTVLERLDGVQLYYVAIAHQDFALEVLEKLDGLQIRYIADAHTEFGIKYLILQQEKNDSLISRYSKFINKDKTLKNNVLAVLNNLNSPRGGWFLSFHWNREYLSEAADLIKKLQSLKKDCNPEEIKKILVEACRNIFAKISCKDYMNFPKITDTSYLRRLIYCYKLTIEAIEPKPVQQNIPISQM